MWWWWWQWRGRVRGCRCGRCEGRRHGCRCGRAYDCPCASDAGPQAAAGGARNDGRAIAGSAHRPQQSKCALARFAGDRSRADLDQQPFSVDATGCCQATHVEPPHCVGPAQLLSALCQTPACARAQLRHARTPAAMPLLHVPSSPVPGRGACAAASLPDGARATACAPLPLCQPRVACRILPHSRYEGKELLFEGPWGNGQEMDSFQLLGWGWDSRSPHLAVHTEAQRRGGVPCAVHALCEKLAVLHHREFGKFRRLKGRH